MKNALIGLSGLLFLGQGALAQGSPNCKPGEREVCKSGPYHILICRCEKRSQRTHTSEAGLDEDGFGTDAEEATDEIGEL